MARAAEHPGNTVHILDRSRRMVAWLRTFEGRARAWLAARVRHLLRPLTRIDPPRLRELLIATAVALLGAAIFVVLFLGPAISRRH